MSFLKEKSVNIVLQIMILGGERDCKHNLKGKKIKGVMA